MGDDLYRLAQVIAAALFAQHGFVDLAGREVIDLAHARGNEALVVAKVQIRLGPVFGHEDFPMLEGAHGAWIDVDIGLELQEGDAQPSGFKDGGKRSSGNALAQGRNDASRSNTVFPPCKFTSPDLPDK